MIKVGVIGAETRMAGELLRILLHHPEVELVFAYSAKLSGQPLTGHHKGLVGDTTLEFTDALPLDEIDVAFIASNDYVVEAGIILPESLKTIQMFPAAGEQPKAPFDSVVAVGAVSELYRKPLVRGARAAKVLPPATTVALIALFPPALHLLLNDDLDVRINVPKTRALLNADKIKAEIDRRIHEVQFSFNSIRNLELTSSGNIRAIDVEIEFPCGIEKDEILKIYESIYDDHNFTFMVDTPPTPNEVAGTHKCLIHISKPSTDVLRIHAVADSMLRGGAGDAVHAMNLLFGLFEKTGLTFPAGLAF